MLSPTRNPWAKGSYLIGIAILVSASVAALAGWIQGTPSLVQVGQGLPYLDGNSILALLAFAGVFVGLHKGRRAASLLALVPAVIGVAALAQFLQGGSWGIDEWMFNHSMDDSPNPGRMSPAMAMCLILGAAPLLAIYFKSTFRNRALFTAVAGSIAGASGFAAIVGYLTELPAAYSWGFAHPMPLLGAVGVLVVGVNIVHIAASDEEPKRSSFEWLP
ncbi:MAG TPA: hypothetical protein VIK52_07170, partial [Opitutaceae bacterium]